MALLDVQVAMIANMNMNYLVSGRVPRRFGNAHANIVPYQVFDAADGQIVLAVGNDGQFAKFCEAARASVQRDARFAKNADRVRHREMLVPMLADVLRDGAASRIGSRCSSRSACRSARSTISPRCSRIRRCVAAACGSICPIRWRVRCRRSRARSACRPLPSNTSWRRRCSDSTRDVDVCGKQTARSDCDAEIDALASRGVIEEAKVPRAS